MQSTVIPYMCWHGNSCSFSSVDGWAGGYNKSKLITPKPRLRTVGDDVWDRQGGQDITATHIQHAKARLSSKSIAYSLDKRYQIGDHESEQPEEIGEEEEHLTKSSP